MAKSHLALFLVGTAANSGKGAAPLGVELVANSHTDSQGSSSAFLSLVELEKLLVGNVVVTISAIMAVAIVLLIARRRINWRWGGGDYWMFPFWSPWPQYCLALEQPRPWRIGHDRINSQVGMLGAQAFTQIG